MPTTAPARRSVVFDMGSVLIGWEVRPPFRPHFSSEEALEEFLRGPFRDIYDAVHDGQGRMADCLAPIRRRYPELEHLIDLYEHEWAGFVTGVMTDTVEIAEELAARGTPLYGLTNWPAQVWPPQRLLPERASEYRFLDLFRDVWVSGHHKLRKPDPRSYRSALERFELAPERAVFVDDLADNVAAAAALGMTAIQFRDAIQLRRELEALALL